eukprot:8480680-Ditylum_brightwellii.AAC.1
MDATQGLIAHGCLDHVRIGLSFTSVVEEGDSPITYSPTISLLAEAIFLSNLSSEQTELSALKFLLTAGCRITASA